MSTPIVNIMPNKREQIYLRHLTAGRLRSTLKTWRDMRSQMCPSLEPIRKDPPDGAN
jgi:hypothetical protein